MKTFVQFTVSILLGVYAMGAAGQSAPPRAGKWEFTLQPQYTDSASLTGGNGSRADIDGAWAFGFGLNYNFNNHLSLGGDLYWSEADYRATVAPAAGNPGSPNTLSGTLQTSSIRMNATWNFLSTNFTPFVTGGVGSTYVDSNIPNGPPSNVCWWDPWYGYYCGSVVPTKSDTYLSYNTGIGLRWDVDRSFFLRGIVIRQWIDVGGALGTPSMDQYRIDFGFKF